MLESPVLKAMSDIDKPTTKEESVKKDSKDTSSKEAKTDERVDKADSTVAKEEDRDNTFRVGDTLKVNYKIIEAGKERIQPFEGVVISKKGMGISKTFTVRRIGDRGVGVERIFPTYSPKISSLEVTKKGKVRRAKLYYLREQRSKKEAKIKERV